MQSAYVNVELVRAAEQAEGSTWQEEITNAASKIERELGSEPTSFQQKTVKRASQLALMTGLSNTYGQILKRNKTIIRVGYLLLAMLGFFAVLQTLSQTSIELNVFWLLLVLVGVNFASICIWLIHSSATLGKKNLTNHASPFAALYKKAILWKYSKTKDTPVLLAWNKLYLHGSTGYWFLSYNIHTAWLWYLVGGIVALIVTLSGQQFNFVWGTTLLSAEAFITLTEHMGAIPKMLGFDVPSHKQILQSQMGSELSSAPELRPIWSSFIFGCVFVYALIPRLILLLSSLLMYQYVRRQFQPNWDAPYFFSLRSRMISKHTSLGIVDVDLESPNQRENNSSLIPESSELMRMTQLALPENMVKILFEWGDISRTQLNKSVIDKAFVVNSADDQNDALSAIKESKAPLALYVPLERAADRGAARFCQTIREYAPLYLIVVQQTSDNSDSVRMASWQSLAESIQLPEANLSFVSL